MKIVAARARITWASGINADYRTQKEDKSYAESAKHKNLNSLFFAPSAKPLHLLRPVVRLTMKTPARPAGYFTTIAVNGHT
jgi:hypothetical protein